ncbi:MAG: hypothetical protein U1F48_07375 [Burkholderiales bacterium]
MSSLLHARCHVCGQPVGNPQRSFDRRIATLGTTRHDGALVTTCNIVFDEALYLYCSDACWDVHQALITSALGLVHTYPATNFVTPCCRCGKPVDRTEPHVAYVITVTRIADEGILMGYCLDDRDFAVLCHDCERPEPVQEEDATSLPLDVEAIA